MSNPSVSVVVPVYNAAEFVAESIESVLCQTWSDFELILVDDGSTDDSAEILRRYARLDSRTKVISRPNTGIAVALNDGIAAARGEFIAIMHADDISFPERLAGQVDYLRKHQGCVAVGSAILRVDSDGSPLHAEQWTCDPAQIRKELLLGRGGLAHPAAMIRADSLRQVGGYRREYELVEDFDLWLRLDEVGALGNLPEVLLAYRRHTMTLSCQHDVRQRQLLVEVVKDAYQRRGLTEKVPVQVKAKRGDSIQRELARWVRGATAGGSFDTASHHMRRLIVEYPTHLRTWSVFVQYVIRWVSHQIKSQLLPRSEAKKVALLNNALRQYRDAQEAMARLETESPQQSPAAETRRIA